jgi:hypothetical protein
MEYFKEYRDRITGELIFRHDFDNEKEFISDPDNFKFYENRFTKEELKDLNLMPKHLFDEIYKEVWNDTVFYKENGEKRKHFIKGKEITIGKGLQESLLSHIFGISTKYYPRS